MSNFLGPILKFESLESTNTYLKELIGLENVCEGTWVLADEQVKGRGQMGTSWESKKGENLLASVVLFPKCININQSFYLYMIAALAVKETLSEYSGASVKVKWPNDVYLNGDKCCGILIENNTSTNKINQTVIGFGINVNQKDFTEVENATSLKLNTASMQVDIDLFEILSLLNARLLKYYNVLKNSDLQKIAIEYIKHLYQIDEWCMYELEGEAIELKITGISNSGLLCLIDRNGKQIAVDLKEISFLRN